MLGFYREDRRAFSPPLGYCSGNPPETSRRQSLQKRPSAQTGMPWTSCAVLCPAAPCGRHPVGQQKAYEHEAPGGGHWRRGHCRLTSCMPESAIQFAKKPLALPFFSSTSPSQNRYAHCITGPQKRTAGRPEMMGRPAALFASGGRLQQEQCSPMRFYTNNDVKLKVSARKYDGAS